MNIAETLALLACEIADRQRDIQALRDAVVERDAKIQELTQCSSASSAPQPASSAPASSPLPPTQ